MLADRAAFWLTVIALSVGFLTFAAWLFVGQSITFAIERMATVMVITCPHALGLAIPLVVAMSTSLSAKNGLLIKNRSAFENARKISVVVFDKTGTLTEGKFGVSSVKSTDGNHDEKEIIKFASALEKSSEHPIARGILEKAQELGISVPDVSDFEAIKGKGVQGIVDGQNVKVVSPGYLKEMGMDIPDHAKDEQLTVVFILKDENIIGTISLADKIREDSYEAIQKLRELGIKCWMLTGDNNQIAKKVNDELKLDGYFAEVLPHEKLEKVKELQSKNEYVAMTGDGVNDAPALAQADVGIAIGSGTDIAAETADIILVESNPKDVTSLILFGRATYKKMIQNLVWATGYNLFAIPLAAGVFYKWGIIISPAVYLLILWKTAIFLYFTAIPYYVFVELLTVYCYMW
ncbi:ATPase, P-type (transporting), HAD superfamily, subfamily IC/heavy metal translocating P-type ATPase [Peptoclostridium litorale DSM 5388]|uniref:P-type Cu(+) transporter n=1 Tax=Peptoclostridium litorale DSM 5388 TaxID=1121324 RepID=A0A069RG60_PEPLI|nr:heavy metal translocating P-type ATPase [Peptoclostridium litorale]KDR95798.1 copper-exporting P-type ATPase B [Peptoclostridium litorale DSM 5388]SIO21099.1 ATPase, P-type (transporting), HAD superfamily, subfamily IC/heavy metal translocating P-type ATPase [Peptoclostridium litorale DSM 5388]